VPDLGLKGNVGWLEGEARWEAEVDFEVAALQTQC
jgi:hypothetical protein